MTRLDTLIVLSSLAHSLIMVVFAVMARFHEMVVSRRMTHLDHVVVLGMVVRFGMVVVYA